MLNLQEFFDSPQIAPERLAELPMHVRRSLTWALELRKMAPDHTLDLSADSTDALDLILDSALHGGFASPAHLIRAVACYFEALVVTHLGAQYVDLGPFQVFLRLVLPGDAGLVFTSPLRLALDAWEKQNPRFNEAFEGLVQLMEDGLDRPLFVPFYDPDDLDPVLEPVWLFAQSLQVILGRFENGQWNLHMLPHNLRFVDEFMVRPPDAAMQLRLVSVSEKPRELRWWQERACAAFFGEMVRAHLGGDWVGPQRGPVEFRVSSGHSFSPLLLCRHALDGERGNYALLSAYQYLMDFLGNGAQGDFPLADLVTEPASASTAAAALQPLPPANDEAPRPSTRQYESTELERQLAEFQAVDVEEDHVGLSTRQYNSAELQRDLISQMHRQAGSPKAVEAELRKSNPMARAFLSGQQTARTPAPRTPPPKDETLEDFEIDVDLGPGPGEIANTPPPARADSLDSAGLQDGLLEMLEAEVQAERRVRQTFEGPLLVGSTPASGATPAMPPSRQPQGERPQRHDPSTVPMAAVDPRNPLNPLHTVATVQGDIPPELAMHLSAQAEAASRDRAPRTEPLTQVERRGRPSTPEHDASTVALSASDPRLRALAAPTASSTPSAPATVEVDASRDARIAALRAMTAPPEQEEAATRAVSASDPRLRALQDAPAATMAVSSNDPRLLALQDLPDEDEDDDSDATEAGLDDHDPRLARASAASSDAMAARNAWPMSSGSLSARTNRAPHGILGEVYPQFRPVLVAPDWERLSEVVHRPVVERGAAQVPHVAIAIDYPDHLLYLNEDDLAAWHVTFDVVFQMACANLAEAPQDLTPFLARLDIDDVVIYQLGIGDFYESSRIFNATLIDTARRLLHCERVLIGIPNRNILLIASGESSVEDVARLRGVAQYCATSQPHALTPHIYLCDNHGRIALVP